MKDTTEICRNGKTYMFDWYETKGEEHISITECGNSEETEMTSMAAEPFI